MRKAKKIRGSFTARAGQIILGVFFLSPVAAFAQSDSSYASPNSSLVSPPAVVSSSGFASAPVATPIPRGGTVAYTTSMDVLDNTRPLVLGDRCSIRVVEDRKPPVETFVTDSGEMEVPLIGRVRAAGKTCKALAKEIKAALDKEYFYNCNVILGLDVASTRSRGKIYITGPVRGQGVMDLPADENLTVSRAILRAGGFMDFADQNRVRVSRKDAKTGQEINLVVPVAKILKTGKGAGDVVLQPEDTILVPTRIATF